jgi:hypothetical protein
MHNEELIDEFDLIINVKHPLGKVTQETAYVHPQISRYPRSTSTEHTS